MRDHGDADMGTNSASVDSASSSRSSADLSARSSADGGSIADASSRSDWGAASDRDAPPDIHNDGGGRGTLTFPDEPIRRWDPVREALVANAEASLSRATGAVPPELRDRLLFVPSEDFDARFNPEAANTGTVVHGLYRVTSGQILLRDDPDALAQSGTVDHEAFHYWREELGGGAPLPRAFNEALTQHWTETFNPVAGKVVETTEIVGPDGERSRIMSVPGINGHVLDHADVSLVPAARSYGHGVDFMRALQDVVSRDALWEYWRTGDATDVGQMVDRRFGDNTWNELESLLGENPSPPQWNHGIERLSVND